MKNYNPSTFHKELIKTITPEFTYNDGCDYAEWREKVKNKYAEIIKKPAKTIDAKPEIEYTEDKETYTEIRYSFESEPGYFVPCHLLIPKAAKKPCPVVICLQGHSTGMHISLGIAKYPGDEAKISGGDRDFAIRAVKEGYAALVMEQRAFGECESDKKDHELGRCHLIAMQAILVGRTVIGERALDISQAIDTLYYFEQLDTDRIACMGNSGGGTATYYASCTEDRIKAVMPSCAFCTLEASIYSIAHCPCNLMPDQYKYFEMQDLACLLAPKKLIIVNGAKDEIFPLDAANKAYETVEKIYAAAGVPDNCAHVIGSEGHRFYADDAWPVFKKLTGWID
ncbi:MAG: hypothetical protein E7588_02870 [Ruminococcaceae bacterium]|nr:hypothetical protein [Oscillospiraceae bacterium]